MKNYYLHIILMMGYFLFVAGSCGEEPEISGCTDSSACNYNIEATILDDSCIFSQENFDCFGNCISQTDEGCECAVLYDECGFCGGDNSSCIDCNGDLNGLAFFDGCENCVGGNTGLALCPSDCLGIDGGTAWINPCMQCVAEDDITCIQGCDGNWSNDGNQLILDDCGICNGINSPNTGVCDCNGIVYPNDNFWKIQFIASNSPLSADITPVVDEENYIGGNQDASDNYDAAFDIIEPPHQGNYVSFYFPHQGWNAWAGDNFTQDIRSNNISDYYNTGKIWKGELFSNITGFVTLSVSSFFNISGLDMLISIDGGEFIQMNLNETTEPKLLMAAQPQEVIIQITNLCY